MRPFFTTTSSKVVRVRSVTRSVSPRSSRKTRSYTSGSKMTPCHVALRNAASGAFDRDRCLLSVSA